MCNTFGPWCSKANSYPYATPPRRPRIFKARPSLFSSKPSPMAGSRGHKMKSKRRSLPWQRTRSVPNICARAYRRIAFCDCICSRDFDDKPRYSYSRTQWLVSPVGSINDMTSHDNLHWLLALNIVTSSQRKVLVLIIVKGWPVTLHKSRPWSWLISGARNLVSAKYCAHQKMCTYLKSIDLMFSDIHVRQNWLEYCLWLWCIPRFVVCTIFGT